MDFKAAYDLISRDKVIEKLLKAKVPMKITQAVRDFLSQRFISVRCNGTDSSYKQVKRGLIQGAVSSTTLFNVMINDICENSRAVEGI